MSRPFELILKELVEAMDNPVDVSVPKELENDISQALQQVEDLPTFWKLTMGSDMRRYFAASPEEQRQIKGAFARTAYLYSLSVPKENFEYIKNKITSPRKSGKVLKSK